MSSEIATNSGVTGIARYVAYVHAQSKTTKKEYEDAGGKIPGFVLKGAGMVIPLGGTTIKLSPVKSEKLLTRIDNKGKIVEAYRAADWKWGTKKVGNFEKYYKPDVPKEFEEHYYVLALLRQGGELYPVTINCCKGPSAGAIRNAHLNLSIAENKEKWAKSGPGFSESAEADGAPGRLVATVTMEPVENQSTGNTYIKGKCTIRPTTKDEVDQYNAILDDDQFKADSLACLANFERSIKLATGELKDETQPEEV